MAPSKLASLHRISLHDGSLRARPLAALVLASSLLGCATQAQTGQLMSAVGTAALIAGAVMTDDGCHGGYERGDERGQPCGDGSMSGSQKAGLGLAVAGLATAAVGNALQEDAARLDARRRVSQGPTYTPTTLPPLAYAPAGTFHPFPASSVVQTTSCTCHEPEPTPAAAPPCAATGSQNEPATPEGAASAKSAPETEAAACPCASVPPSSVVTPAAPGEETAPRPR